MIDRITTVKKKLDDAINQLCEVSWMFSKHPEKDFTRTRKLPFRKVVSFLLSMEGGSLTNEMMKHFGCSAEIASSSAFVQQRGKLSETAFPDLFALFVSKTDSPKLYKGLRLIAADGSDIQIPTNRCHAESFFRVQMGKPLITCFTWMQCMICFNTYIWMPTYAARELKTREYLCVKW